MRFACRLVLLLSVLTYVTAAFAAVTVSVNGSNHTIPQSGEKGWGTNVTTWIQAISANTLQPNGGNFTLTADTNFGANFGLLSLYYKSRSSNVSSSGILRLANTDSIGFRNAANDGNLLLALDGDVLEFNGEPLVESSELDDYAPLASPTFTGVVTSPAFVGDLTGAVTGNVTGDVTGNVTGDVTGDVTGNADTATALAANPSDCASDRFATTIAANGNLTCAQVSLTAAVSGALPIANGGTGQDTAQEAIDALVPSQTGNGGEFLTTDGTNVTWASPAGSGLSVVSRTTTDTVESTEDVVLASTSGGAWTLTLYTASGNSGKVLRVVKTTNDFTVLTIDGHDSETINGAADTTLNSQYESVTLVSDGTNWHILDRRIPSGWTSWTPTGTWSSNTTYTGYKRRVGDSEEYIVGIAVSGAPTSATLKINLPNTLDTTKILSPAGNSHAIFGTGMIFDANGDIYSAKANYDTSGTAVLIAYENVDGGSPSKLRPNFGVTQAAPMTFASGDKIWVRFSIPISGWKD